MSITRTEELTAFGRLYIFSQTSGANAIQTCSTDGLQPYRLLHVMCSYSASPTQAGVTTTINSGLGSVFDVLLNTGSSDTQVTVYQPTLPITLRTTDVLDVAAPAGGGVITSSVVIYCLAS